MPAIHSVAWGEVFRFNAAPQAAIVTPFFAIANTYTNITPRQHKAIVRTQKKQAKWLFAFIACLILVWSAYANPSSVAFALIR